MDKEREPGAFAGHRPFQQLLIAVGVAECGDWAAADMTLNPNRLAVLVVDYIDRGQLHQHRLAITHLVLKFHAAADYLLRRDAIDFFRPRAHELDAAPGDNEGL